MSQAILKDIRGAVFRANPEYELVTLDQLSPKQQTYLSMLTEQPDVFGLLRPRRGESRMIKTVSSEAAQVFNTLQQPGTLPFAAREQLARERDPNRSLAELVLDGVLEISAEEGFVSGAAAYHVIYRSASTPTARGTLATLSLQALQHAELLPAQNPAALSLYLYNYNRLPLSLYWSRRLPSTDAAAAYLGLESQSATGRKLHQFWVQSPGDNAASESGWRFWTRRSFHSYTETERPTYKLYVSPLPTHLPEVFSATVEVFTAHDVAHFKVGKDAYGLLRPDKLIAYVDTMDALQAVAEDLRQRLSGIPAHGVPFTAELGLNGLLSWGIDPPSTEQSTAWKQRESWRLWISNRLASALGEARLQPAPTLAAWRFALERLRLDGVDPATWTPIDSLWEPAVSARADKLEPIS